MARASCARRLPRSDFQPNLLVNNAGVGVLGPFAELPLEQARDMIRLNILALTDLTYRVLSDMLARGEGAIINVGSASAFQPVPNYGVYAATKAFVISFTAALWAEMPRPTACGWWPSARRGRRRPASWRGLVQAAETPSARR